MRVVCRWRSGAHPAWTGHLVGHFPNSRRWSGIFRTRDATAPHIRHLIHVCMFETRVAFVGQFLLLRVCGWVAERIHSASCSSFLPDERSNAACRPHGCERVHCSPKCKKDRFSLISGFHQNEDRRDRRNSPLRHARGHACNRVRAWLLAACMVLCNSFACTFVISTCIILIRYNHVV